MLADGAEATVLSMILVILANEWNIGSGFKEAFISILFLGILIGSVSSGQISDRFGRYKASCIASVIMFIFGILSIFSHGPISFVAYRGLFGVGVGCVYPLTSVVIAETHPTSVRGKYIGF